MRLDLRAPLFYERTDIIIAGQPNQKETDLPDKFKKEEEIILCFEINSKESRKIDPNTEQFIGSLVFAGISRGQAASSAENLADAVCLPKGDYLFVQQRSAAAEEACAGWLELAIEQQKDGLWERNKLGDMLYVRFLFEDEAYVVQVFRTLFIV